MPFLLDLIFRQYTFSLQVWQTISNDCTNDFQDILVRSLEQEDEDDIPQSIRDFRLIKVIGQGAFSKGDFSASFNFQFLSYWLTRAVYPCRLFSIVWHASRIRNSIEKAVTSPRDQQIHACEGGTQYSSPEKAPKDYAIKIQQFTAKKKVSKCQLRAKEEHLVLQKVKHPFIVKLYWTLQDYSLMNETYFLVLELVQGGTLFELQSSQPKHRFNKKQTKFYTAEVYLALEHLHSKNIIFRDLKPENVLVTCIGHIKLTDFGMAKQLLTTEERHQSILGTPQFMAPEIIENQAYTYPVDFWALGCLVFEMLHSYSPFANKNLKEMFVKILKADYEERMSADISVDAKEFIRQLLKRLPEDRLGCSMIRQHVYFRGFDWDAACKLELVPPLIPTIRAPSTMSQNERCAVGDAAASSSTQFQSITHRTLLDSPDEPVANFSKITDEECAARVELVRRFNALRSKSCIDRSAWAEILDECVVYTLPSTVYRRQWNGSHTQTKVTRSPMVTVAETLARVRRTRHKKRQRRHPVCRAGCGPAN